MRSQASRQQGNAPEKITATGSVENPEVTEEELKAGDGQLVGTAITKEDPEEKKLVNFYQVTRGGFIQQDGGTRARLPAGKILHDNAYDIQLLRRQGIGLKEIGPGTPANPPDVPMDNAAGA